MSYLDKDTIKQILDLGKGFITESIADRQLEVIRKGFNYLSQPENSLIYVGDEVGLGKTYVALGIASLLRHFSTTPESYQDMILVPKENLQVKWNREIQQFIRNNYLQEDNRVKSVLGKPVAKTELHSKLEPFTSYSSGYHIYRNNTFSMNLAGGKWELFQPLRDRLPSQAAKDILWEAWEKGYWKAEFKGLLKRLFAYLFNSCLPTINLLIVDEGHNYKHGNNESVAARNQVVSRCLGILQPKEDAQLLADFPQIRKIVRPVVNKVIVLSATPKTAGLWEIRNQLDCFLPSHILTDTKTEEDIKTALTKFFIRGNLNYDIDGTSYSRNRCRNEHRNGNVEKVVNAQPLTIQNDEQSAFLSLLQYKTIRHLDAKHNASFELGMLAGFETFNRDMQVRQERQDALSTARLIIESGEESEADAEYEEVRERKTRNSQDKEVIVPLLNSYHAAFDVEPPHPKQDALVQAVGKMMLKGEKSLVFVRRIGSANELERRFSNFFEERITTELKNKWSKIAESDLLNRWAEGYDNRQILKESNRLFGAISNRLLSNRNDYPFDFKEGENKEETIQKGLSYLFAGGIEPADAELRQGWMEQLRKHLRRERYERELIDLSFKLLKPYWRSWETPDADNIAEQDDEPAAYFFHIHPASELKKVRNKLLKSDWLNLNFYLIQQAIPFGFFDGNKFLQALNASKDKENFKTVQQTVLNCITQNELVGSDPPESLSKLSQLQEATLLTTLLLQYFREELQLFIEKRREDVLVFQKDLQVLEAILQGVLRKGSGFVPLATAASSKEGEKLFLKMVTTQGSVFSLVLQEVKKIFTDFTLLKTVNFSDDTGSEDTQRILRKLNGQAPAISVTGQNGRNRSIIAAQFRMPGFPYVLVTTDIFREGEDLHTYCQNIYHYGIAWNCSDMEQRTGRIDRINSISYRRLRDRQRLDFDNKVHVFYPFINGTLEVNQVACLYSSLNSFIETFNDFTQPHKEEAQAKTTAVISELPAVIDTQLISKYEHHSFQDEGQSDQNVLTLQQRIGQDDGALLHHLQLLINSIEQQCWPDYYLKPVLTSSTLEIRGVAKLHQRDGRRGPFILTLINGDAPGSFKLKVTSHICTAVSKLLSSIKAQQENYIVETIGSFYTLTQVYDFTKQSLPELISAIQVLVLHADDIESRVTKNDEMPL